MDATSDVADPARGQELRSTLLAELEDATRRAQVRSIAIVQLAVWENWIFAIGLVAGGAVLIIRAMMRRIERNIARLTETNKQLLNSERRLKDFVDTGVHQFWETDRDHRFTWVEAAGRRGGIEDKSIFLGKPRREVAGQFGDTQGVDWSAHRQVLDSHKCFETFGYSIRFLDGSKMC